MAMLNNQMVPPINPYLKWPVISVRIWTINPCGYPATFQDGAVHSSARFHCAESKQALGQPKNNNGKYFQTNHRWNKKKLVLLCTKFFQATPIQPLRWFLLQSLSLLCHHSLPLTQNSLPSLAPMKEGNQSASTRHYSHNIPLIVFCLLLPQKETNLEVETYSFLRFLMLAVEKATSLSFTCWLIIWIIARKKSVRWEHHPSHTGVENGPKNYGLTSLLKKNFRRPLPTAVGARQRSNYTSRTGNKLWLAWFPLVISGSIATMIGVLYYILGERTMLYIYISISNLNCIGI